jgi:hypothetical protein
VDGLIDSTFKFLLKNYDYFSFTATFVALLTGELIAARGAYHL